MEKSLNVVEKLSDQLYVITETESVHCYLVIGSDKAMLFDIGYGYENIMPLVRTITDLPVMLVLSHGDPDHGLGTKWFDEVWIHPLDWGKLLWNDTTEMRKKAMDQQDAMDERTDTGRFHRMENQQSDETTFSLSWRQDFTGRY